VSQFPRIVLADTVVTWGEVPIFVRHGTTVDIIPGSVLETAYGGPPNLAALSPLTRDEIQDKSALAN
jgi:hypothetical protein